MGHEIDVLKRLLATFRAIANLSQPSRSAAKAVLNFCVYDPRSVPPEWIDLSYEFFKLPGRKQAMISMIKTNFNFWGLKNEVFKPIVERLQNIIAPTLILWGKQDRAIRVKYAHIAAKNIPDTCLHIFDRCGHWAQVEYAAEFNQLTLNFLK